MRRSSRPHGEDACTEKASVSAWPRCTDKLQQSAKTSLLGLRWMRFPAPAYFALTERFSCHTHLQSIYTGNTDIGMLRQPTSFRLTAALQRPRLNFAFRPLQSPYSGGSVQRNDTGTLHPPSESADDHRASVSPLLRSSQPESRPLRKSISITDLPLPALGLHAPVQHPSSHSHTQPAVMRPNSSLLSLLSLSACLTSASPVVSPELEERQSCPQIHIFGARETTAPPGYGTAGSVVNRILSAHPGSSAEAINYPASGTNPTYSQSVLAGTNAVCNQVSSFARRCPSTKLVLVGYSQVRRLSQYHGSNPGDGKQPNLTLSRVRRSSTTPSAAAATRTKASRAPAPSPRTTSPRRSSWATHGSARAHRTTSAAAPRAV